MGVRTQTLRGRFAARLLRDHITKQYHRQKREPGNELPDFKGIPLLRKPDVEIPHHEVSPVGKVCIVGAGAAGIYMAWMLSYLGIEYDLLEASGDLGGRIFTYKFPDDANCAHNYYDVGAMRIPRNDSNQPTIDVINCLNIPTAPYYLGNALAPNYFDRAQITSQDITKQLQPLTDALQTFVDMLNQDFEKGFRYLIDQGYDMQSTRQYLRDQGIVVDEIQALETFNTGTGLFDQSLTETIIDYAEFQDDSIEWIRVEGGMKGFIDTMAKKVSTPATLNTTVRAYKMDGKKVAVTSTDANGNTITNNYAAAFNSTTLGALGRIELDNLGSKNQLTAIRSLAYDSAAKVAIKFKTAWWITDGGMAVATGGNKGGSSTTDLPIRVVVYPSWMDSDDPGNPSVLIASYTWHQDAIRIGSLTGNAKGQPQSPASTSEVVQLILRNLAVMFKDRNPAITYGYLIDQVQDYHTYAWQNDPHASGAFALFGPGQFTSLYPSLFSPLLHSNNSIYIMGEHASAHHAWIAGALDSARTSLYGWLMGLGQIGIDYATCLKNADASQYPWGGKFPEEEPTDVFEGGGDRMMKAGEMKLDVGGIPDEMEEDVVYWMAQLALRKPTDGLLRG